MATDPYGNEIDDPFDVAIAQGVMYSTWRSAVFSVLFALSTTCCVPFAFFSANVLYTWTFIAALLALAAAINVLIRVFTMPPELKKLVPSWHPLGAAGLSLVGVVIGGLQLLSSVAYLAAQFFGFA